VFEISKSKTIAAPVERVFAAWQSAPKRKRWLADPDIEISTATAPKSIRFRWVDGKSRAQAWFLDKGEKTSVTVSHTKLADVKSANRMKRYWTIQLDALAAEFTP
jgi:uncharacterized protein YndB with AHSA1/START domain